MELGIDTDKVTWREIDGEIIAVDLGREEYLSLNDSAAILWRELAKGATAEELTGHLVTAFEIEPEQATHDVEVFVTTLRQRALLRNAD